MLKFKLFTNFEEEEKYLTDMAQNGFVFKKQGMIFYHFSKDTPSALNYRIDYRIFDSNNKYSEYITFFEDCGWKLVYGSPNIGFHYFIPIKSDAKEEIFSDRISYADRYKRLAKHLVQNVIGQLLFLLVVYIVLNYINLDGLNMENVAAIFILKALPFYAILTLPLLGYYFLKTWKIYRQILSRQNEY